MRAVRVVSRERGSVVAARCLVAESSRDRTKGLLGRDSLAEDEALWIVPCSSIHTCFMRFSMDAVFLDRDHRILRVAADIPPFRVRARRGAHSVLEVPAGRVGRVGVRLGEVLEFVPLDS